MSPKKNAFPTIVRQGVGVGVLSLCVLCVAGAKPREQEAAPPFQIREWSFVWTVVHAESSRLTVEKTYERLGIILYTRFDMVRLPAKDAEAIGKALMGTAVHFDQLRGTSRKVCQDTDNYTVEFAWRDETGFRVSILSKKGSFADGVWLTREQAETFAPHLCRAEAMLKFVDQRVRP
jgi:hypothetical protein